MSRVVCSHEAVLGTEATVTGWRAHGACPGVEFVGRWQVAIAADDPETQTRVRRSLTAIGDQGSVAGSLARLTREDLPPCSVLLSDGEDAAGLAWGEPLGLTELGGWEFSVTSAPGDRGPWSRLTPGTIVALDSCGPVVFPVPFPQEVR